MALFEFNERPGTGEADTELVDKIIEEAIDVVLVLLHTSYMTCSSWT